MSRSYNKVMLLGNVGSEINARTTPGGTRVVNLSLATNLPPKTDRAGQKHEQPPEWHRVTFWDRAAEIIEEFCQPGDRLFVEGRLQYQKYTRENETSERVVAAITAREFVLLGDGVRERHANTAAEKAGVASPFGADDGDLPF